MAFLEQLAFGGTASWKQLLDQKDPEVDGDGNLAPPWGDALRAAVVYENQTPGWFEDPAFKEPNEGPAGQILEYLCSKGFDSMSEAGDKVEQAAHGGDLTMRGTGPPPDGGEKGFDWDGPMDEDEMQAAQDAVDDDEEPEFEDGDDEDVPPPPKTRALQLNHRLDPTKFHVGVKWVHLVNLPGRKAKYNGIKAMVTQFGVRDASKVRVRSAKKISPSGKYVGLWVHRINCKNTVHKQNGAWVHTPNPVNTGPTGAARWYSLGRSEVDKMQGKLKWQKTPEEEAYRDELFGLMDVNGNRYISLAELDKALPNLMQCVALFNAKPVIIRAFLAATGRPPTSDESRAFRKHARSYVQSGEQFRLLMQYLHEYFELYLIFQDMGDSDYDRRIDVVEWSKFIQSGNAEKIGIKVTPEILADKCGDTDMPGYSLFNEIDTDQGGCILFKEFSEYCIRKSLGSENPIGWASDQDDAGTYVVTNRVAWVGSDCYQVSRDLGLVYDGMILQVEEVVNWEEKKRIRARIASPPGWISIINQVTGKRWASKLNKNKTRDLFGGGSNNESEIEETPDLKVRLLFHESKDTPEGMTRDCFGGVCDQLGGLEAEEVDALFATADKNGSGIIEPNEYVDWIFSDSVSLEDRQALGVES